MPLVNYQGCTGQWGCEGGIAEPDREVSFRGKETRRRGREGKRHG